MSLNSLFIPQYITSCSYVMTGTKNKVVVVKKKSKKSKVFSEPPELDPDAQVYRGPITSRAGREEADLHTVLLFYIAELISTGGGVVNNVMDDNPSNASEWSNFSALFHEYRVLGATLEFWPQNRYSKSTTITRPVAAIVDRSAAGALGSYAAAFNHPSARMVGLDDPFKVVWHMENAEESTFLQTASSAARHWFKLYADTVSNTTTYGIYRVSLLTQFRGRQ